MSRWTAVVKNDWKPKLSSLFLLLCTFISLKKERKKSIEKDKRLSLATAVSQALNLTEHLDDVTTDALIDSDRCLRANRQTKLL